MEKETLEQSNAPVAWVLGGKVSQLMSMAESLLKTVLLPGPLGHHLDHMNWEFEQEREAENGEHPLHQSEVVLKAAIDDADLNGLLQSPKKEHQ